MYHAVFLARQGETPDTIRNAIHVQYGYDLSRSVDEIRPSYHFDESCQGTVPEAITCALEATGFVDAIRNAVSLGGDADTLAAIAGSIAEPLYGVPADVESNVMAYLHPVLIDTLSRFREKTRR